MLVDAPNAFNYVNCHVALLNMFYFIPAYCNKVPHRVISWQCPYIPLVLSLLTTDGHLPDMFWYADDAASRGNLLQPRDCLSELLYFGCHFVIMSMLLRSGYLLRKYVCIQLTSFMMVLVFSLCPLVSLTCVQLLAVQITSRIIHRIAYFNGLVICLSYL